jgi:TM2 domain-containing membrane protein YozV
VPQQAIPDIPSPVQQLFQEPQAPALPPDVQPVVLVYQLKDPGWAAVFSFFLHGLGFVYLGNFGWFIIWCLIDIVIILLYFVLIGMFIYPIASIVASIMAYNQAEKWNNKQRAVYMQKRVAPHA